MQIDKHIINKINDAHEGVLQSSKDAVQYALLAGRELIRAKSMCKHGEFLAIVNSGAFKFKERTARNYMKVAEYSAKTQTLADLQSAYKLIESEENKRKQAESTDRYERMVYREKYGEKPEGWQRSDDYEWKKFNENKQAQQERIDRAKQKMKEQSEATASKREELDRLMQESQSGTEILKDFFDKEQQKINNLNNLRISNQNGGVLGLLEQYLHGLNTDSQRIEECHNIIKYCKNMARELQVIKEESTSKTIDY